MTDVTIIGAGPAGSAAAVLLARAGRSVAIIEQHRFPRDKVCGECVSALGVEILDRLGILPTLREAGAVSLRRAMIHAPTGEPIAAPLPRPMLGISRRVLDEILLKSALDAGVIVRQPARCEAILGGSATKDQPICIRIRDLESNVIETLTSSLLILADGKFALPDTPPKATGDIGIKSHWIGVDGPRDAIELFGCSGCYGGLAAIEGERWNAAFSVPAGRVRDHHGNVDSLFAGLLSENHSLSRRLLPAARIGPWLASPLPRFGVRKKWMPRVIPIGNAAAAMEPIGGEGMGLALRSAELAVGAIFASGTSWTRANERQLRHAYEALWRLRRFACRATAMVVSSANAADVAIEWARNNDGLAALAMRAMGK